MLSEILNKSTCAECRFCCAFRRASLWEAPYIAPKTVKKLSDKKGFKRVTVNKKYCYKMILENRYKTNDENEEAACFFLDPNRGCTLSEEDKPFDCKIWPLRIMKKGAAYVIALVPTCPAINKLPIEKIKELVEDKLSQEIRNYAKKNPFIIKDYVEEFPVLESFEKL